MRQHIAEEKRDRTRKREKERERERDHPPPPPPPPRSSHSLLAHRLAQVHGATPGESPHLAEIVVGPQVGKWGPPLAVAGQVLGLGLGGQGPHLAPAAPVEGVQLRVGHAEGGGAELGQGLAGLTGSPLQRPHGATLPVLEQYPHAPLEGGREVGRRREKEGWREKKKSKCNAASTQTTGQSSYGARAAAGVGRDAQTQGF